MIERTTTIAPVLFSLVTVTDGRTLSERVDDLQRAHDRMKDLLGTLLATLRIPANAGKFHGPDFERLVTGWQEEYQSITGEQ